MYWIVSPEKKKIFRFENYSNVIFYETLGDDDSWVGGEEKVVIIFEEKSTILGDLMPLTL
jgi:hypothetical protein